MKKDTNISTILSKDIDEGAIPTSPSPNEKIYDVCYLILEISPKGMSYIDLTGRFPVCSAKGNKYLLVA